MRVKIPKSWSHSVSSHPDKYTVSVGTRASRAGSFKVSESSKLARTSRNNAVTTKSTKK